MKTKLLVCALAFPAALAACSSVAEPIAERSEALGPEMPASCVSTVGDGLPDDLRCTGLYADWEQQAIDQGALAYTPGFELWSDGASKRRFIRLPPGTKIDARDMNAWVFPVGTRLWKEFRLPVAGAGAGTPVVETRMMEKTRQGTWAFATYVWSADQRSAPRVRTGVMPFPGTTNYEVPKERDCIQCHGRRADRVLGFEAVLLAQAEARGLTYATLRARDLLDTGNAAPPEPEALAIPGNAIERDALGRLHVNCGVSCHGPTGSFSMRIDIANGRAPSGVVQTSVFTEAINQPSYFTPAGGTTSLDRIRPTDPERSAIFYRLATRDEPGGHEQMPPLGTHVVDPALVDSVGTWVRSMTAAPYPAPTPR